MRRTIFLLVLVIMINSLSCSGGSSVPTLRFITTTLPPGITQVAYNYTISVRGGKQPYVFTVYSGVLPNGLALNNTTGIISGTPSKAGKFDFTIRITDSQNVPQFVEKALSIEIVDKLEFVSTKLGDGSINIPYSDFVLVKGGKQPYIFGLKSGTLPTGYVLNSSTGEITGISSTTNSYNFEIMVADGSSPNQIITKAFSIAISPPFGTWSDLSSTSNQPSARYNHFSFYDSKQNRVYVMWGTDGITYNVDGRYYSFVDGNWHTTYTTGAPTPTLNGCCLHMGDPPSVSNINHYMFFGGESAPNTYVNSGGMYGTENNRWGGLIPPISTQLPSARSEFASLALGNYSAFFFGGILQGGTLTNDAYHYTFNDSTFESVWTKTNTPPITPRKDAKIARVGNRIYVWGGMQTSAVSDTGAYYDLQSKTWTAMSQTNAPSARWNHIMIGVGNNIVVWGGDDDNGHYYNDGAVYDTTANSWSTMNLGGSPSARSCASVVYNSTSGEIFIWGGWNGTTFYNTGGAYKVSNDGWRTLTSNGAPAGRKGHTAVWTGTQMIVYGGINSVGAITGPKAFTP